MSKLIQIQEQKQKLNPKQILEAKIMQLNSNILEKRVLEEIENNPILELEEEIEDDNNPDEEENINNFNWDELVSNPEEFGIKSKQNSIDHNFSPTKTLADDFLMQLNDVNMQDEEIIIAEYILGNLNDDGYLMIEPIIISDKFNVSEKIVNNLIEKIQLLDPPGIASRNIQECLFSQLKQLYPNEILAIKVVNNYFDDFAKHNYNKIINKVKCTTNEFNNALHLISILNPKPASNYSTAVSEHIIPDIVVEKQKNKWVVITHDNFFPKLCISNNYKKLLNKKGTKDDAKKFIKQKIISASWFIEAISNRFITIQKVMESIIKHQKLYFNFENRELVPMSLKNVAKDIDMDISSISRSTNGKYVQLPWGCVELKSFFSEGIKTKDGRQVSNTVIKKLIKDIINNENKRKPLNDNEITNILIDKGYIIARRTVTKYREFENISIARLRRHSIT